MPPFAKRRRFTAKQLRELLCASTILFQENQGFEESLRESASFFQAYKGTVLRLWPHPVDRLHEVPLVALLVVSMNLQGGRTFFGQHPGAPAVQYGPKLTNPFDEDAPYIMAWMHGDGYIGQCEVLGPAAVLDRLLLKTEERQPWTPVVLNGGLSESGQAGG